MLSFDINDNHIKFIDGKKSGKKLNVKSCGSCELEEGAVKNGYIQDIQLVAAEISALLKEHKVNEKNAVINISSSDVLYKEIFAPKMKNMTELDMESMISKDMGIGADYNITYSILGEVVDEGALMLKILGMATPQRLIDAYKSLFSQTGLKLKKIYLSNNSQTRMIGYQNQFDLDMPMVVLMVEKTFITINYYVNNTLTSTRHIIIDPEDYEGNADYMNLAVFDNMFRFIHFLNNLPNAEKIRKILYYSNVPLNSLESSLAQFNTDIERFSLPNFVDMSKAAESEGSSFNPDMFVECIGAFIKPKRKNENANLIISEAMRISHANKVFAGTAIGVVAVYIVSITGVTLYTDQLRQIKSDQLDAYKNEYALMHHEEMKFYKSSAEYAVASYETYVEKANEARFIFDIIPTAHPAIITKLYEQMFAGMYIIGDINIDSYDIKVTFSCTKESEPAKYTERLIEQNYFDVIGYDGYQKKDDGTYEFTLPLRLKGGEKF